jgi:hypothetical protein
VFYQSGGPIQPVAAAKTCHVSFDALRTRKPSAAERLSSKCEHKSLQVTAVFIS